MSTMFGLKLPSGKMTEVAFRHGIPGNKVQIDILNPLLVLMPTETEVYALDNSAQGISTVGDIFKESPSKVIIFLELEGVCR